MQPATERAGDAPSLRRHDPDQVHRVGRLFQLTSQPYWHPMELFQYEGSTLLGQLNAGAEQ